MGLRWLVGVALAGALLVSVGTSAQASFPGANGKIAFSSARDGNYEIYSMDPDGGGVTRLTENLQGDFEPAFSADGLSLAFTRGGDVWSMAADGSGEKLIATGAREPAWSPDGAKIAFVRSDAEGSDHIWVMNANGTGQQQVTFDSPLDRGPDWSPNGKKIAFTSNRHGTTELLYVMDADGQNVTRLTTVDDPPGAMSERDPSWSPDGSQIAMRSMNDFGENGYDRAQIWVVEADGSTRTLVVAENAGQPSWSPDGKQISFTSRLSPSSNGNEIVVVKLDGGELTRLTTNEAEDLQSAWQPLPIAVETADLSVTKSDSPDPVTAGAELTYTIVVSNAGTATAQAVTVVDPLPAGVTFVASEPVDSCSGTTTVTCELGALEPGTGATVTIVVVPDAPGTLSNTATVTTATTDPNPSNNSATAETTVVAPPPTPTISISDVSVTEGDDGITLATFTVTRSSGTGTSRVELLTAEGTATANIDYAHRDGTVEFAEGETSQTVDVDVRGDMDDEADETFFVNLSGASGATLADAQGQGTIIDDDDPAPPVLAIDDVTVTEGDLGTVDAVFTVSRTGGTGVSTVGWETANDTATAGLDYTGASGSVSFEGDETSMTISISVLGDTSDEANETFFVNLSNASGATIADGQGIGTIVDDDTSAPPAPIGVSGPCSKHGTLGDDQLTGSSAADWICGWRGDDTIFGLAGADRLLGGDGDDLLEGGLGPDDLDAGPGADVIDAFGDGPDEVDGGPGFDTCYCGPEDNVTGIERFIPHGK